MRLTPEEGGIFLLHELSLSGLEDVQQARKQYKVTLQSCCAGCLGVTWRKFLGGQVNRTGKLHQQLSSWPHSKACSPVRPLTACCNLVHAHCQVKG